MRSIDCQFDFFQVHFLDLAPALQASLVASPVKKNPPHRLSRGGEEMASAVPMLDLLDIDQSEIRIMHQRVACSVCPGFS